VILITRIFRDAEKRVACFPPPPSRKGNSRAAGGESRREVILLQRGGSEERPWGEGLVGEETVLITQRQTKSGHSTQGSLRKKIAIGAEWGGTTAYRIIITEKWLLATRGDKQKGRLPSKKKTYGE